MKKYYYADILFVVILALVVSTLLPVFVSRRQETQLLNQTVVEELSAVKVNRTEKMEEKSCLEKFAFLLEDGIEYIKYMPIVEGRTMDSVSAEQCLMNEMQLLFDMGVLPSGELGLWKAGELYTAANTNNPAQSLLVWRFLVMGAFDECYEVTLDDSTGKIILLNAVWIIRDMEEFYGAAYESVARMWGDYIGMGTLSEMRIRDLRYVQHPEERIMQRMGNDSKQIMELYGITDEGSLKQILNDKNRIMEVYDAQIYDSEMYAKTNIAIDSDKKDGIEIDVSYYGDDGTIIECILEWDVNGYSFRKSENVNR